MTTQRDSILVVTNGQSGLDAISSAVRDANILAWNDVLHEGPVSDSPDLRKVSDGRVQYLKGTVDKLEPNRDIAGEFRQRDAVLMSALESAEENEVVLFFESDLYDQLQVAQIMWVATRVGFERISIVPWSGSLLAGDGRIESAFESRQRVGESELDGFVAFWRAFISEQPEDLARVVADLASESGPLGVLRVAGVRLLEEYPGLDGVSRTERQVLHVLSAGCASAGTLFAKCLALEEDPFMGDWSFFGIVDGLVACTDPLVSRTDSGEFDLTGWGRRVAFGEVDNLTRNRVDRWLGGVHVAGPPVWRWDSETRRLLSPR